MADRILADRYRLVSQLGEGGMGQVWEAYDQMLERPVAVKLISALAGGGSSGDEARARFLREARITARLQHPHIVTVHDLGEAAVAEGTAPFLVMELLRGKGLDAVLGRGPVSLSDASRWGTQMCEALAEAHAAGILHRDIKPANIVVSASGTVKVLDFGIARAADPTTTRDRITHTGAVIGTLQYMAPEHARGRPEQRSDLYALGCVLFEMVTGRLPFEAPDPTAYLAAHLAEVPPAPSSVAAGIPAAWDEVVLTLLRKEPSERFDSALQLAAALRNLEAGGADHPGPRTPTVVDPAGAPSRSAATVLQPSEPLESPGPLSPRLVTVVAAQKRVADIAFAPDGDRLALVQVSGTVIVTDLSGVEQLRLAHPGRWMTGEASVAFSPDGTRLATVWRDRTLRLWDASTGAEQLRVSHGGGPFRVAFSPDGIRLATVAQDGVRLWNTRTGDVLRHERGDHLRDVAFSPDGTHLAITGLQRLALLDVRTDREVVPMRAGGPEAVHEGVAFSPDGARLAVASSGRGAHIVDVGTGEVLFRVDREGWRVQDVAFNSRGDWLATTGEDPFVRLWDTRTGELLFTIDHSGSSRRVAFSPKGFMLAIADEETVQLWRIIE